MERRRAFKKMGKNCFLFVLHTKFEKLPVKKKLLGKPEKIGVRVIYPCRSSNPGFIHLSFLKQLTSWLGVVVLSLLLHSRPVVLC